jgi:hypothetical protein
MAAAHGSPEVIEYPDKGTLVVMARTESQRGGQLVSEHRLDHAVEQDWSKR